VPPALVWLPSDDATAERTEWCRLFAFALREVRAAGPAHPDRLRVSGNSLRSQRS